MRCSIHSMVWVNILIAPEVTLQFFGKEKVFILFWNRNTVQYSTVLFLFSILRIRFLRDLFVFLLLYRGYLIIDNSKRGERGRGSRDGG